MSFDAQGKPILRCRRLDFESVKEICGESKQAMVYGFARCRYEDVARRLKEEGSPIQKVYDCSLGGIDTEGRAVASSEYITTIEGRLMTQIPFPLLDRHPQGISRPSKAGVTNLIFENYKREKEKLLLIPCIFCIDIDDNPIPFSIENVTNNENSDGDTSIALKELRRGYKLCCTFDDADVRRVANATFKFVKLAKIGEDAYKLQLLRAPWEHPDWEKLWEARKAKPKRVDRLELEGYETDWRTQLKQAIEDYKKKPAISDRSGEGLI